MIIFLFDFQLIDALESLEISYGFFDFSDENKLSSKIAFVHTQKASDLHVEVHGILNPYS